MTPDDEVRFIQLWQKGLSHEAMAQRLGCPVGTVKSRSHTLQRRGLIQPRPKGQASQGLQRQGDTVEVSPDTPEVSRGVSTRTRQPSARVSRRVSPDTRGVSAGVSGGVSGRTPLPAERGKSVRWNLHLTEGLRARIKALAATRRLQDSQIVEELLWLALSVVETSADR
jgi:hypothetical protein